MPDNATTNACCKSQSTDSGAAEGAVLTLGLGPATAMDNTYNGNSQSTAILNNNIINQQSQNATLGQTIQSIQLKQLAELNCSYPISF